MFKVITYPFFNDFLGFCAEAKERIILTTPFIKTEIVENIFEVIDGNLSIPQNHHREVKIRQVLQNLRDLGLIEFTRPGVYRRLWGRGDGHEN